MPYLRFESGPEKGASRRIDSKRLSVGRSQQNDLVVSDETVSSFHATVTYLNKAHFIEDVGSANGTLVNGIRIHRKRLRDNDEIQMGNTRLRYLLSLAEEEAHHQVQRKDSKEIIKSFSSESPPPENVEALRQAHENLKRVYEVNRIISSIFDLKQLAAKILDIVFPFFDADRGYLMLLDKWTSELQLIATKKKAGSPDVSSDVAFSRTIAQRVLDNEESIITSNAFEDKRFARKESILDGHIISAMCVPIRGRKEKLGIIYVDHRGSPGHFTEEHLQLLTMVANSAGVAIDNIRLYEENLKINILNAVNEEMRETNRKLRELEALKEDLVNMIVHDMKNPVNNTMLALDMIAYDPANQPTEQQAEYLQMAKRNQFKLSEMITNLLEISKLESGKIQIEKTAIDTADLVNRTVERYAALTKKEDKAVHARIDPAAQIIQSDPRLLERILSNMISNAIKHSEAKGEIFIEVIPAKEENSVSFSIQDFGEGIPEEFHQTIFEKFCQAELREFGRKTDTGLGLAFCKMAVEALGGAISLESAPGKGSRFTFTLPATLP
jgi:K+-sensing histidine kinase KdpD